MHSSTSFIGVLKSRARFAGNMGLRGQTWSDYKHLYENLKERGHLEDTGLDGRTIFKRFQIRKNGVEMTTGSAHDRTPVSAVMKLGFHKRSNIFN